VTNSTVCFETSGFTTSPWEGRARRHLGLVVGGERREDHVRDARQLDLDVDRLLGLEQRRIVHVDAGATGFTGGRPPHSHAPTRGSPSGGCRLRRPRNRASRRGVGWAWNQRNARDPGERIDG